MTEVSPWGVALGARAQHDLARLPPRIAVAVVEFVTATLPANPERLTKPLTGDLEGYRSARRGDYRVIVELIEDEHLILVVRIGHRAHVYRPS